MVALIGHAEMDEGNIFEALLEARASQYLVSGGL